jgi:formylmethanofuran dehydrogenase subunit E
MDQSGQVYFLSTEAPEQTVEDVARYKQALAAELLGQSVPVDTNPPADEPRILAQTCDDCGDNVVEQGQGTTCGSCLAERP